MRIDFSGSAVSFDDLPVGGFFMFDLHRGGAFGLCVAIGKKAAVVFPREGTQERFALQVGGLTHETFICFADAVLRPDQSSIAGGEATSDGALTSVDGHYYMKAQEGVYYHNFHVQSGLAEDPRGTSNAFHFARWKVGSIIDQKFEPIFSFPAGT